MKKGLILSVASLMCLTSLIGCNHNNNNTSSSSDSSSVAPSSSSSSVAPSSSSSSSVAPSSSSSSVAPSSSSSSSSSSQAVVRVSAVNVGPARVTLYLEDEDPSRTLNLIVLPNNATNKEVVWTSSKEDVATVDENGKVTALKMGTATITATSKDDATKKGSSVITVKQSKTQDLTLSDLNKPLFLSKYQQNTASLDDVTTIQTNKNYSKTSYYKNEEEKADTYKVGNQNEFKVNVIGKLIDDSGHISEINNPFTKVKYELFNNELNKYEDIPESELANHVSLNEAKDAYQFTAAAKGNLYRLTISADESMYVNISEYCSDVVLEVEVVDGYNVYSKEDLAIFDNVQHEWDTLKEEKGIKDLTAKGIVLHSDIEITNDDVPQAFRWSEAEINEYVKNYDDDFTKWCTKKHFVKEDGTTLDKELGKETLIDSLKDYSTIYWRGTNGENDDFAIEGNYFKIDTSKIKQVYSFNNGIQEGCVNTEYVPDDGSGCDGSHAQLFGINSENTDVAFGPYGGGTVNVNNLTVIGNGNRSDDDKYAGGLITFKMRGVDFIAENVITSRSFTTFMSMMSEGEVKKTSMVLDRCKNFDSYNSLVYVWGCDKNLITNSVMTDAGGAVALLDEVDADDATSSRRAYPKVDCYNVYFENLLTGAEPWFVAHHASEAVQMMEAFGLPTCWLGKNAVANGEHMNILATDAQGKPYLDLIAIDINGRDPFGNSLQKGGTMLEGHFNIYNDPEMTSLIHGLDMGKLAAANPLAGTEAFVGAAIQEYMTGNALPLYRLMAAQANSAGLFVTTATGHGMLYDAATFKQGLVGALNDPRSPMNTPINEQVSISPIPFYDNDGNQVAAALDEYKANMDGLATGDYMSLYLTMSAQAEYLGAFVKLHKIGE